MPHSLHLMSDSEKKKKFNSNLLETCAKRIFYFVLAGRVLRSEP